MRDRIRIRKTGPKRWTVRIPTIGFGPGETVDKPSHRAAIKEANQRIHRPGSTDLTTETQWQPGDGISPTPTWTPLWTPDQP